MTPRDGSCLVRTETHFAWSVLRVITRSRRQPWDSACSTTSRSRPSWRFATMSDRVLVIDWDVHHGNGTQDTFWESEQVGFLSIHRWPFYPGSGDEDETGHGKGLGTTVNIPLEFGVSRKDYLDCFARELDDFANKLRPQFVLLSAGFDAHVLDPVGSLGLETEDFVTLTEMVTAVADQHAEGRLVSVLEGGYNTEILPDCIAAHLECLVKRQK